MPFLFSLSLSGCRCPSWEVWEEAFPQLITVSLFGGRAQPDEHIRAAGDGVSAGHCPACASRSCCLLEPILPEPGLRFQPKEELSGVVEAPNVLKWGFGGKKPFPNSAVELASCSVFLWLLYWMFVVGSELIFAFCCISQQSWSPVFNIANSCHRENYLEGEISYLKSHLR